MELSTAPFALVVDDDALIRMEACAILRDAGFRCHDVESGDAAKALLERVAEHVTLLFTDVQMPGQTDGFALARHVAAQWPHIEIVVASGALRPEPGDMPEKATFIGKPFDEHIVTAHLRDILPDHKQPEQLKTAV